MTHSRRLTTVQFPFDRGCQIDQRTTPCRSGLMSHRNLMHGTGLMTSNQSPTFARAHHRSAKNELAHRLSVLHERLAQLKLRHERYHAAAHESEEISREVEDVLAKMEQRTKVIRHLRRLCPLPHICSFTQLCLRYVDRSIYQFEHIFRFNLKTGEHYQSTVFPDAHSRIKVRLTANRHSSSPRHRHTRRRSTRRGKKY